MFTTDEGRRGGKTLHLKSIVDKAVGMADCVEKVMVFTATGAEVYTYVCTCVRCVMSCHALATLFLIRRQLQPRLHIRCARRVWAGATLAGGGS